MVRRKIDKPNKPDKHWYSLEGWKKHSIIHIHILGILGWGAGNWPGHWEGSKNLSGILDWVDSDHSDKSFFLHINLLND